MKHLLNTNGDLNLISTGKISDSTDPILIAYQTDVHFFSILHRKGQNFTERVETTERKRSKYIRFRTA